MVKVKLKDFRKIILKYRYVLGKQKNGHHKNISSRKQIVITMITSDREKM